MILCSPLYHNANTCKKMRVILERFGIYSSYKSTLLMYLRDFSKSDNAAILYTAQLTAKGRCNRIFLGGVAILRIYADRRDRHACGVRTSEKLG